MSEVRRGGNLSTWFHAQVHNDFHNSQAQKNTHPVITSTIGPIDCKDGIGLALARFILFNWTLSEVLVELFSSAFLPVMRSEAEWSVIWQNSHLAQQSVDTIVIWQNSHLTRLSVNTTVIWQNAKVKLEGVASVSGKLHTLEPGEWHRWISISNLWIFQVRRVD